VVLLHAALAYTRCQRMSARSPATMLLQACRRERYLLWTRNHGDFYAGHKHKWHSLYCALWEAHKLGRKLVIDSFAGMDK
jgi:hypothetical protein